MITAHLCHLCSALVLHELSGSIQLHVAPAVKSKFAFLAAALHIISPAGIFLSAPYTESLFSLLSFSAMYLYAAARLKRTTPRWRNEISLILAGLLFGAATTVRGNGLLSGLIFAFDAIAYGLAFSSSRNLRVHFRSLCVTIVAGMVMAFIAIIPQYLAWVEYCSPPSGGMRPWCSQAFPSIYAWVQSHYW